MKTIKKGAAKATPTLKLTSKKTLIKQEYHEGSLFGIFDKIRELRIEMERDIYNTQGWSNEITNREIVRQNFA